MPSKQPTIDTNKDIIPMTKSKQQMYKQLRNTEKMLKDINEHEDNSHTNEYHLMDIATDVTKIDMFWRDVQPHKPRRYKTDAEMFIRIMEYFRLNQLTKHKGVDRKGVMIDMKEPMSWLSLLHYLKLIRQTAEPYLHGEYDDNDNSYSALLSWASEIIENDLQVGATNNTYNERAVLATLQAKYKWSIETKLSIDHTYQLSADEATRELMQLMQSAKQAVQSLVIDVDID